MHWKRLIGSSLVRCAVLAVAGGCNIRYSANVDFGTTAGSGRNARPAQASAADGKSRGAARSLTAPAPARVASNQRPDSGRRDLARTPPAAQVVERRVLEPLACYRLRSLEAKGQALSTSFDKAAQLGVLDAKCRVERAKLEAYGHLSSAWYESLPSAAELRSQEVDPTRLAIAAAGLRDFVAAGIVLNPSMDREVIPAAALAKWDAYDALRTDLKTVVLLPAVWSKCSWPNAFPVMTSPTTCGNE